VATGTQRDDATLREGLARWVAAHPELVSGRPGTGGAGGGAGAGAGGGDGPSPHVESLEHAGGGMANETVLVDFGPSHPKMVVRLAPLEPTFPDYELAPQALVQNALAAAGVPAPAPAVVEHDPAWVGAPFLVMPMVSGDIPGPAPVFDPYVMEARPDLQRRMHDGLVDTLAAIHAVPWEASGLGGILPGLTVHDALARWSAYAEWSAQGDPLPALATALEWCGRRPPAARDTVLLWGDVRLGNLVFDPERRVTAVLDWDLASLGPREMDLGWHFGLEFMMASLFGRSVPGFPDRAESLARYERASGYAVREGELDWHEVFALVRALAINDRHQRITGATHRRDNPMGAVLLERMETAASL
jgi:aminoglycoside phosphotransferase (APT) family kinase protein